MELQPTDLDAACAQRLYDYSQTPGMVEKYGVQEIKQLQHELFMHYKKTGMYAHQRLQAKFNIVRGGLRASRGVILHAMEIEHNQYIQELRARGKPLTLPDNIDARWQDRLFRYYGTYNERELHFLRASGYLACQTVNRFVRRAVGDKNHWSAPLLDLYRFSLQEYLPIVDELHPIDSHLHGSDWLRRLRNVMVMGNVTVVNVFTPAAHHLPLWSGEGKSSEELLRSHVPELATLSSINREVMDRYFPGQTQGAKPPERCPFEHNATKIAATGRVLRIPSIEIGAWPVIRMCPEDMPLSSPHHQSAGPVTGAEMRFYSSIPVAAETLWA